MRLAILALVLALPLRAQAPLPTPTPEQLIDARRLDEAKPLVQAMLASNKNDPRGLYLMGPDSVNGYYGLASFLRNQGRWDEAFATYEQLMKLKPMRSRCT